MKLFNAIAAATFIGSSILFCTTANAFWGRKELTYEQLLQRNYSSSQWDDYQAAKLAGDNWIYAGKTPGGDTYAIQKVGCTGAKCLFLQAFSPKMDWIWMEVMNCANRSMKFHHVHNPSEDGKFEPLEDYEYQMYKTICG